MQLEDERRHADQYKEQVEKVCTSCAVLLFARIHTHMNVHTLLPSLPPVPTKWNCREMVKEHLFSCPFNCAYYFLGMFL
jgi:hypothetical protein